MFARLAKLLGIDQPFYGLQARGLTVEKKPFMRVEDMAAHYIEEIRSVPAERAIPDRRDVHRRPGGLMKSHNSRRRRGRGDPGRDGVVASAILSDALEPTAVSPLALALRGDENHDLPSPRQLPVREWGTFWKENCNGCGI